VAPGRKVIRSVKELRICLDENTLEFPGLGFEEASDMGPPGRSLLDIIF